MIEERVNAKDMDIFCLVPACSQSIIDIKMINLSTMGGGGGVVLRYVSHISMCIPKGYGF